MGQVLGKGGDNSEVKKTNKIDTNKIPKIPKIQENPVANMSLANGTNTHNNEETASNYTPEIKTNLFCKKKKAKKDGIKRKIEDLEFQLKSIKVSLLLEIEELRKTLSENTNTNNTNHNNNDTNIANLTSRMDTSDSVIVGLIAEQAQLKTSLQNSTEHRQKTLSVVAKALESVMG